MALKECESWSRICHVLPVLLLIPLCRAWGLESFWFCTSWLWPDSTPFLWSTTKPRPLTSPPCIEHRQELGHPQSRTLFGPWSGCGKWFSFLDCHHSWDICRASSNLFLHIGAQFPHRHGKQTSWQLFPLFGRPKRKSIGQPTLGQISYMRFTRVDFIYFLYYYI